MLNIKIDDEYKLTSDSRNYVLNKYSHKDGEEVLTPVAYCSSVTHVLKTYRERSIRLSDASTIPHLLTVVQGIDKKIDEILGGL